MPSDCPHPRQFASPPPPKLGVTVYLVDIGGSFLVYWLFRPPNFVW